MAVTQADDMATWRFGRVRRIYWMLLVGALLAAIAAPTVTLWRAASSALAAHACIWPPAPQAGTTAQLIVALSDPMDRAAVHGPWAQVVAEWDMVNMRMGTRQIAVPGPSGHADTVTLPLRLDMAGPWWVQVALRTPGRPVWHARLQVAVQPPGATAAASPAQAAMSLRDACGPGGGSTSV